jgi:hypothetical protein
MPHVVSDLYTYPVKSLTPQRLEQVELEVGAPFPYDRAFALKKGDWAFDAENPEYRFKTFFHVLLKDERLAALKSSFNVSSGTLTLEDREGGVIKSDLTTREGRAIMETFLKNFLSADVEIVSARDFSFSDVSMKVASIINLASVRALGEAVGAGLDPLRFRGNIHIDGEAPWSEFDLAGKKFKLGECTFETVKRISRCAATNVNLKTAKRDQNLPRALTRNFGHADMGIYAKVIGAGSFKVGDKITPL